MTPVRKYQLNKSVDLTDLGLESPISTEPASQLKKRNIESALNNTISEDYQATPEVEKTETKRKPDRESQERKSEEK